MTDTVQLARRVRKHIVNMTNAGNSSHVGSALSITDIASVLYGAFLKVDPSNPKWPDRDRFILSKGHAGACIYAVLAETGFFPVEQLRNHYQNGSILSGHVSHKGVPGVELSTGSLGHGLPVAVGMAYAAKLDQKKHKVVCLLSDGECDEGSNWEAFMAAAHFKLGNLIAVIDYNKLQSLASIEATIGLEPFTDKITAFGWKVIEVDGHDHAELLRALRVAADSDTKPVCILAHTIKGKGVSFMENQVLWHYRSPQGQEYLDALNELEK